MPTENRSSTIDPRDLFIRLNPLGLSKEDLRKDSTGFEDQSTHNDYLLFLAGYRESHPEPQPHPEPIAWMVGTAIWWTKGEAERDAAETGLPIVGLGPMAGVALAEQHQAEPMAPAFVMPSCENSYGFGYVDGTCIQSLRGYRDHLEEIVDSIPEGPLYTHADPGDVERLRNCLRTEIEAGDSWKREAEELRAQLAVRDALLRDKSGDLIRMAANLISAPLFALQDLQDEDKKMTRARVDHAVDVADARLKDAAYELRRIADALSASAEPGAPVERDHEIPGTSFQRLNALANQGE